MSARTLRCSFLLAAVGLAAQMLACGDPCASPESEAILTAAAAEEGAVRTESGLVFLALTPGSGAKPKLGNRVSVHYEGRLPDGTIFDSTNRQGLPRTFGLDQMIPGWTEGLLMMHGGGKAKLTIPAKLAYGRKGKKRKIPRCSILTFEIELLGVYD